MKVLLQNTQTKLFYVGPGQWTAHRAEALDFHEIERAAQTYVTEGLNYAEIVVEEGTVDSRIPEPASWAVPVAPGGK